MHLHFPLSCLFSKETSGIPAVPTNHLLSLLRCAALLLLCLLQAGEPQTLAGAEPILGEGPQPSWALLQLLTPPPAPSCPPPASASPTWVCTCWVPSHSPRGHFTSTVSHTGRHPQSGKQWKEAGRARHAPSQGSAQAAAAPNQPKEAPSRRSPSCSTRIH